MRCYFLRDNQIEFVELLKAGSDDDLTEQAKELLRQRNGVHFDRLEVWEGRRLVNRHPSPTKIADSQIRTLRGFFAGDIPSIPPIPSIVWRRLAALPYPGLRGGAWCVPTHPPQLEAQQLYPAYAAASRFAFAAASRFPRSAASLRSSPTKHPRRCSARSRFRR
jgi:hypothetical protein